MTVSGFAPLQPVHCGITGGAVGDTIQGVTT